MTTTQTPTNTTMNVTDAALARLRTCVVCLLPKDIDEFYKDAGCVGGRRTECKACHIAKVMHKMATPEVVSAGRAFTEALQGHWRDALDAIAGQTCGDCAGSMALVQAGTGRLCKCVHDKIFDDIMSAYDQCSASGGTRGEITEHHVSGFGGGVSYSRKNQEFCADVEIVVRRVARRLDESIKFREVFPYHELLAKAVIIRHWQVTLVCRTTPALGASTERRARLALDRVARAVAVEAVEMQPYPLFPIHKYFSETPINTLAGQPDVRRDFRVAFQRDSAAKSAAKYDERSY